MMGERIVMINFPELIEKLKFRKAIEALETYQSEEEYLDAMMAITERGVAGNLDFTK